MGVGGVLISLTLAVSPQVDKPLACDAWPVRRQTYGYLPGRRASPFVRYQIILLDDRGTRVLATRPELLPDGAPAGSRTRDLSISSPTR